MKQEGSPPANLGSRVAPRTGAWIETPSMFQPVKTPVVAPRTGAWIETPEVPRWRDVKDVAPRTGAWIETAG